MNFYEVIWDGRGSLPMPPGRSWEDDARYHQRTDYISVETKAVNAQQAYNRRRKQRELSTAVTTKCEQCWTRWVPVSDVKRGVKRCRTCVKGSSRRKARA